MKTTVGGREPKLEGLGSVRSLSASPDLQRPERLQPCGSNVAEAHWAPSSAVPRRPPLGLTAALKVTNRDLDRCLETDRDLIGEGHAARTRNPETPQAPGKTRRGRTLGRRLAGTGKAWRTPKADVNLALAAGA